MRYRHFSTKCILAPGKVSARGSFLCGLIKNSVWPPRALKFLYMDRQTQQERDYWEWDWDWERLRSRLGKRDRAIRICGEEAAVRSAASLSVQAHYAWGISAWSEIIEIEIDIETEIEVKTGRDRETHIYGRRLRYVLPPRYQFKLTMHEA